MSRDDCRCQGKQCFNVVKGVGVVTFVYVCMACTDAHERKFVLKLVVVLEIKICLYVILTQPPLCRIQRLTSVRIVPHSSSNAVHHPPSLGLLPPQCCSISRYAVRKSFTTFSQVSSRTNGPTISCSGTPALAASRRPSTYDVSRESPIAISLRATAWASALER